METVRQGVFGDAAAIAEVMNLTREEALPALPKLYTIEQIKVWIENSVLVNCQVWVVEIAGAVVAFIALAGEDLEHLYVHPQYWSRGLGTKLLDLVKEKAGRLKLYTFQSNDRSRKFYEQRGFRLLELSDGSGNEEKEPDATYVWERPVSLCDQIRSTEGIA